MFRGCAKKQAVTGMPPIRRSAKRKLVTDAVPVQPVTTRRQRARPNPTPASDAAGGGGGGGYGATALAI